MQYQIQSDQNRRKLLLCTTILTAYLVQPTHSMSCTTCTAPEKTPATSQENCNNSSSSFAIISIFLPVACVNIHKDLHRNTTHCTRQPGQVSCCVCLSPCRIPDWPSSVNQTIAKFIFIDISLFATLNLKFECPCKDLFLLFPLLL